MKNVLHQYLLAVTEHFSQQHQQIVLLGYGIFRR